MKKISKLRKRILALILCFTLAFSQNMLAFAEDGPADPAIETASEEIVEEEIVEEEEEEVEEEEEEAEEEPVEPAAEEPEAPAEEPEAPVEEAEVPVEEAEVPVEEAEAPAEEAEVPAEEPEAPVEEPEETTEEVEDSEEEFEEPEVAVFATEDTSVTVNAPKGTFAVTSNKVAMTAETVSEERMPEITAALQDALEEEGKELSDFIVYDIDLWEEVVEETTEEVELQKANLLLPVEVVFGNAELEIPETEEVVEVLGFQLDEENNVEFMEGEITEEGAAVLSAEHFTETGIVVAVNKPAITRYDYKSDIVNVLVTLRNPEDLPDAAELVVTPITLEEEVESDVCVEAMKDDIILKEIHAFDIKFMLDGEEVQPGKTVTVNISLPGMDMDEDTTVYHIDEQNNIENMDGEVTKEGDVEFETPHFSTYVVVPTVDGNDGSEYSNRTRLSFSRIRTSGGKGVTVDKTAKVDDWDNRTYDITISAEVDLSTTETVNRVADGMLVMDISGSMLWAMNDTGYGSASHGSIGNYDKIRNNTEKLQKSKVYTIGTNGQRPFAYFDYPEENRDGWYYYETNKEPVVNVELYWNGNKDSSVTPIPGKTYNDGNWIKIADNSNWTVYDWSEHRLTTLKQLIRSYMESAASISPKSYLGMTAFYHNGYNVFDPMPVVSDGVVNTDMVKRVAAMFPQKEWCTYPNTGLELAFKGMVSANSSYNDEGTGSINFGSYNANFTRKVDGYEVGKYLILFSDGEPDGLADPGTSDDAKQIAQIEKETQAWAEEFKKHGVKIYTVAFAYNRSNSDWLTDIASEGCTYTADTMEQLKAALEDIQRKETTETVEEISVNVIDYIDPRFVILDNEGNPIGVDYEGVTEGVEITTKGFDGQTEVTRTGKVHYDAQGRQYIVWADQKAKKIGSSWTVKVQAQENYIGANDIHTNINLDMDGSTLLTKVDAGQYGTYDLPNPKVNVKATMEIGNDDVIIYKGTAAPTQCTSATDPLTMMYNANEKIEEYLKPGYAGVEPKDFVLTWYTDAACTTEVAGETLAKQLETMAAAGLNAETNYYLKFTYDPGTVAESSDANANTTKAGVTYIAGRNDDDHGNDARFVEATNAAAKNEDPEIAAKYKDAEGNPLTYGIYNIKLWQIVKHVNDEEGTPLAGAKFTLTNDDNTYYGVSGEDGFVTLYTDYVDADNNTAALNTPIGTYTLAETETPDGYILNDETWTLTTSLKGEGALVNGVDSITSSTEEPVVKETPDGVVASYIYFNDIIVCELPATGSIGTAIFTKTGFGLLVSAAALSMLARKKEEEN